jgi:hypothetical protein
MDSDTWIYEPWTSSPTKINVNTGTFGQLWLAYYQVMADQPNNTTPNIRTWMPAFPAPATSAAPGTPPGTARMFRSPLRYVPQPLPNLPVGLTPTQVMQLRAALAAVNTIDMRDSDDNVSSRTVHLIDANNTTGALQDVTATVYGMERQPFITQVYATDLQYTDQSLRVHNGFVAIELYNPYNVPIDLSSYTLAYANRTSVTPTAANLATTTNLTFTPIPWIGTTTDPAYPPQAPVIPPNSSIVIASGGVSAAAGATGPSTLDPTSLPPTGAAPPGANLMFDGNVVPAQYPYPWQTPPTTQTYLYVLTGLCPQTNSGALGNELYLFRGRLEKAGSTGTGTTNTITPATLSTFPAAGPAPSTQPTTPTVAGTLTTQFNETSLLPGGANPADMVPLDSFDFTGLYPAGGFQTSPGSAHEWYYVRPNPLGDPRKAWHFVYPGHIVMSNIAATSTGAPLPRLIDGTVYSGGPDPTPNAGGTPLPPIPNGIGVALFKAKNVHEINFPQYELPLGIKKATGSLTSVVEGDTATLTYRDIPLELNASDFGGPNAGSQRTSTPTEGAIPAFPFGGFARNGDILEVPYIGAYRLMIPQPGSGSIVPTQIIEMNPPTMDSLMALGLAQPEWGDGSAAANPIDAGVPTTGGDPIYGPNGTNNIAIEQVGRFCPIGTADITKAPAYTYPLNDYFLPEGGTATSPYWLYHFGTRLFDYLTVQSPQLDMLPDVDPGASDPNSVSQNWEYGPTNTSAANQPAPVANVNGLTFNAEPGNPNGATEESATVQGLVNINTAPWRVLAAIPWVPPTYANHAIDNANIALSIVYYRDVYDGSPGAVQHGHGPFKSIFELGSVKIYNMAGGDIGSGTGTYLRDIFTATPPSTSGPGPNAIAADEGDLTAVYPNTLNPVIGDFKSQYQMINRVSNLITTRSDSFTAYVLLQGWRNAETPGATLAVQRRAAFRIDRSGITPINNTSPTVTFVPNQ